MFISRTQLSMFSWCLFPKHGCPRSLCVYFQNTAIHSLFVFVSKTQLSPSLGVYFLNTTIHILFVFISKTQPPTFSLCVFPKHCCLCSLGVYFQDTGVHILLVFASKTQLSMFSWCLFPEHNHPCSLGVYFQVLPGV